MLWGTIGGICVILILAFCWALLSAAAPPKERCPKCGKWIYPIEMDTYTYYECECGYRNKK